MKYPIQYRVKHYVVSLIVTVGADRSIKESLLLIFLVVSFLHSLFPLFATSEVATRTFSITASSVSVSGFIILHLPFYKGSIGLACIVNR